MISNHPTKYGSIEVTLSHGAIKRAIVALENRDVTKDSSIEQSELENFINGLHAELARSNIRRK